MTTLLKTKTTATGGPVASESKDRTYQATVTGTGAVSATVLIEVSNSNTSFMTLGTITLSGTDSASDGFPSNANWEFTRASVTAISGTGAQVTVDMGE